MPAFRTVVASARAPSSWRRSRGLLAALTLGLVVVCGTSNADEGAVGANRAEAADLLVRMSEALRTLSYSGTFVHLAGDNLSSMAILHSFVDGGELERLSALDGEAREVFRDHSLVTCIWPGTRSVVVTSSKPRSPLPVIDARLADDTLYAVSLGPDDRVAGRPARQVKVMPRDALRYGYRFWIDGERHMLLRSMLLDESGRPIEQLLFTRIEYPDAIPREHFEPRIDGARDSWVDKRLAASAEAASAAVPDRAEGRVEFDSLPAGYRKISERFDAMPIADGPVSHVMLSDGMASVSVYIEHVPVERQDTTATGHSRMGAVNAYGLSLDEALVTAVGEVPAETVKRIAMAARVRR